MTKKEFENLVGQELTPEQYSKVEDVFMDINFTSDIRETKQAVVDIYKLNSSYITEILYRVVDADFKNARLALDMQDKIDELNENADILSNEVDNLTAENETLRNKVEYQRNLGIDCISVIWEKNQQLKAENEELRTQLHQYQALFADIEKNMTVSLYSTLMGSVQ